MAKPLLSRVVLSEDNLRVSSVLNQDVKQYGKQNLLDSNEETCWQTDKGPCQWILIKFPHKVRLDEIRLQFQGGFSPKTIVVKNVDHQTGMGEKELETFWPDDNSSLQIFPLPSPPVVGQFKISLEESNDLFGRMVVYKLELYGATSVA